MCHIVPSSLVVILVDGSDWTGMEYWNTGMDCWNDIFWFYIHIFRSGVTVYLGGFDNISALIIL